MRLSLSPSSCHALQALLYCHRNSSFDVMILRLLSVLASLGSTILANPSKSTYTSAGPGRQSQYGPHESYGSTRYVPPNSPRDQKPSIATFDKSYKYFGPPARTLTGSNYGNKRSYPIESTGGYSGRPAKFTGHVGESIRPIGTTDSILTLESHCDEQMFDRLFCCINTYSPNCENCIEHCNTVDEAYDKEIPDAGMLGRAVKYGQPAAPGAYFGIIPNTAGDPSSYMQRSLGSFESTVTAYGHQPVTGYGSDGSGSFGGSMDASYGHQPGTGYGFGGSGSFGGSTDASYGHQPGIGYGSDGSGSFGRSTDASYGHQPGIGYESDGSGSFGGSTDASYGHQPGTSYGSDGSGSFGGSTDGSYGDQSGTGYGADSSYGHKPGTNYESGGSGSFGGSSDGSYGHQPGTNYESGGSGSFGGSTDGSYGDQSGTGYGADSSYGHKPGTNYESGGSGSFGGSSDGSYGHQPGTNYESGGSGSFGGSSDGSYGHQPASNYGGSVSVGGSRDALYGHLPGTGYGSAGSGSFGGFTDGSFGEQSGTDYGSGGSASYGGSTDASYGQQPGTGYGSGGSGSVGGSTDASHGHQADTAYGSGRSGSFEGYTDASYEHQPGTAYGSGRSGSFDGYTDASYEHQPGTGYGSGGSGSFGGSTDASYGHLPGTSYGSGGSGLFGGSTDVSYGHLPGTGYGSGGAESFGGSTLSGGFVFDPTDVGPAGFHSDRQVTAPTPRASYGSGRSRSILDSYQSENRNYGRRLPHGKSFRSPPTFNLARNAAVFDTGESKISGELPYASYEASAHYSPDVRHRPPTDSFWSVWSSWSPCYDGVQSRGRACTYNHARSSGGCSGQSQQSRPCESGETSYIAPGTSTNSPTPQRAYIAGGRVHDEKSSAQFKKESRPTSAEHGVTISEDRIEPITPTSETTASHREAVTFPTKVIAPENSTSFKVKRKIPGGYEMKA